MANATKISISYVLGSGENHPDNPLSFNLNDQPIELHTPTKEHYTFKGWYQTPNFSDSPTNQINPSDIHIDDPTIQEELVESGRGPEFLWTIFDNMGVPYNEDVRFDGSITIDSENYKISSIRLEPKLSESDRVGTIHLKFSEFQKFINNESQRLINPIERLSIPYEYHTGEMFGISIYPMEENNFKYPGLINFNSFIMQKQRVNELIANKLIPPFRYLPELDTVVGYINNRKTSVFVNKLSLLVVIVKHNNENINTLYFIDTKSQHIIHTINSDINNHFKEIIYWEKAKSFIVSLENDIKFIDQTNFKFKFDDVTVNRGYSIIQVIKRSDSQILIKYDELFDFNSLSYENDNVSTDIVTGLNKFTEYFEDTSFYVDYSTGHTVLKENTIVNPRNILISDTLNIVYNVIPITINRFECLIVSMDKGLGIVVLKKTDIINNDMIIEDPNDPENPDPENPEGPEDDEQAALDKIWGPDDENPDEDDILDPNDHGRLIIESPQFEFIYSNENDFMNNPHLSIIERQGKLLMTIVRNSRQESLSLNHPYEALISSVSLKLRATYTMGDEVASGWEIYFDTKPLDLFSSIHLNHKDTLKDTVLIDFFEDSYENIFILSHNQNLSNGDLFTWKPGLINNQNGGYINLLAKDGLEKPLLVQDFTGSLLIDKSKLRHEVKNFTLSNPNN